MILRQLACAVVLTCSAPAVYAVEILEPPTLTMDPNGVTPLAGVVELVTDVPVLATLTITDGTDIRTVDFPEAAQELYLPVLGLKPAHSYTVQVDLTPGGFAGSLAAVTPALPADFPVVTLLTADPAQMEPGYTLLGRFGRTNNDPRPTYAMIVDDQGEVVWYSECCAGSVVQLPNGHLLSRSATGALEQDLLGNIVLDLPFDAIALHHDLVRTPAGTYLSLQHEAVIVDDYPTSETDPGAPTASASVRDQLVVEFLPDGSLRGAWSLMDLLDRTRIGYGSLNSVAFGLDWGHANAVVYDAADDSFVVSIRHQDAVVKFSRATGELIWILGPHANWKPELMPFLLTPVGTPFRWQYHQHASMITSDGTVMLFDNGNDRASPFDGTPQVPDDQNFSRGVEFDVDEPSMTVSQLWEWGENIDEPLFTNRISDANPLETTGNVLMTFGAVSYVDGVLSGDLGLGSVHARIIETTGDTVAEKVFELRIHDATSRITIYRSERIPDLYPQTSFKAPNGIGTTLLADKNGSAIEFSWAPPPTDASHDEAEYYIVYRASDVDGGFSMRETSAQTSVAIESTGDVEFYAVVAANLAGTSGDEP